MPFRGALSSICLTLFNRPGSFIPADATMRLPATRDTD